MRLKYISKILFVLVLLPLPAMAQNAATSGGQAVPPIKPGETISLERCLEIGLRLNPAIAAARQAALVNKNRVGEAKSAYYPQVSAQAGDFTASTGAPAASAFSAGRTNGVIGFSGTASLSQNIYDFGRTSSSVKGQQFLFRSSQKDLRDTQDSVILAIKQAYFGVLQAIHNLAVQQQAVTQFQQHLDQALAFHSAGTVAKYDVTRAEVDLSNAKLALLNAGGAVKVAKIQLNNAMGLTNAPDYTIQDNLSISPTGPTLADALSSAYNQRADLQSLILREQSQKQAIRLAKSNFLPFITASAEYGYGGERFPLEHAWGAGATITFPVFNGFITKYQARENTAALALLKQNETALRQAIYLQVDQAWIQTDVARQSVDAANLALTQAKENLDVANGRYKYGVGNQIEVSDAMAAYVSAGYSCNAALYNYKTAQAALERAMGLGGPK